MEAYTCDADYVYAVTLSAELSGSYNSAELGKKLYEEDMGKRKSISLIPALPPSERR
ncbi:MAG: hypothetical protein V8Q27_05880 [Eubacteriales bacterium]